MYDIDSTTTTSVVGRKADEPDDVPEECEAPSTYSAAGDSLPIDVSKKVNDFLDDPEIQAVTRFEDLNLSPELMKGLYVEMKFERPSKIQSMSLPMILTPPYKNLIAQAYKGSGKTTCFVLGMLRRVDPKLDAPQALCLCPTRELAIQIMEVLLKMGKFTGITSELCLPADKANYIPVSKRAPVTAQVIIGSPGTINMCIAHKKLATSNLKILVFEETDLILEEGGYKEDSVRIMKEIVRWSPKCQVLLFSDSATFDDNDTVKAFVSTIVKDLFVEEFHQFLIKKEELSFDSVKQYKVNLVDELSKIMVIKDKIMGLGDGVRQTIIFVGTRKSAGMLHEALVKDGYAVTTILDTLTPKDKNKKNKEFKDGLIQVLIATDFLAQGFDLSQVNLVVNYDLPVKYSTRPDPEAYLRRIGRAGQFGRKAAVFNLLCGYKDSKIMEYIERHYNYYLTLLPSWSSDDDFKDALKKAGLMGTGL